MLSLTKCVSQVEQGKLCPIQTMCVLHVKRQLCHHYSKYCPGFKWKLCVLYSSQSMSTHLLHLKKTQTNKQFFRFQGYISNKHVHSTFNLLSLGGSTHKHTGRKRKQHSLSQQHTYDCRRGCDLYVSGRNTYMWWKTLYDSLGQGNAAAFP